MSRAALSVADENEGDEENDASDSREESLTAEAAYRINLKGIPAGENQ
jgi:hypothetical protein